MLKTTPLVVTIGLSLTIPLAILGDEILQKPTQIQAMIGALLVLGSFGLVGWQNAETVPQIDESDQFDGVDAERTHNIGSSSITTNQ
jgi:solute carrier family 35 protein F5